MQNYVMTISSFHFAAMKQQNITKCVESC